MSRRYCEPPHHESPQELCLWAIVDSLVNYGSEKMAYLAFAQELMAAVLSSSFVHRSSTDVADFLPRTKRVVAKWFRRRLSGHLMWLIGREVLG